MCGIAGIVNAASPITDGQLRAMEVVLQRMSYRGPDGLGLWRDDRVLLGHRRLSIIDLSEAGGQPLHDPERDTHLTFNGEIFNYRELRQDLEARGYPFLTSTDTEVILASYAFHGDDFVDRLDGMFAFVLHDRRRHKVILCRDRLGKKPLYYSFDAEKLVVFSELKFFHSLPDFPLSLDPESVRAFFALQYIPGPGTIYTQIRKLPPGNVLEVDLHSWQMKRRRYWCIEGCFSSRAADRPSMNDLDRSIAESVRLRLVSDVPVGVLLSGGIDSSLLSAYASALASAPLTGFMVRFDDRHLDEAPYARLVARSLGMPLVELDGGRADSDVFERVTYHADEPLGDPACIPTYLINEEISRHVKVVLSGEGADELFWGYPRYQREMFYLRLAPLLPHGMFGMDPGVLGRMEDMSLCGRDVSRLAKVLSAPLGLGCARWATIHGEGSLSRLLGPLITENHHSPRYVRELVGLYDALLSQTSCLEASLATDLASWLPDDLLAKVDRMSMAHGVEARAPFLAYPLVELALRLSPEQKADLTETKKILRRLLVQKLPLAAGRRIAARGKHGFDVPLHRWLTHDLRAMAEDLLSPASIRECPFLSSTYVRALWGRCQDGITSTAFLRKIWLIVAFMSWYRHHQSHFDLR
ncbi:MAG: asparagine synthase (glutamine-hydrolyzing) [Syntrophobacteraceae bacterium]